MADDGRTHTREELEARYTLANGVYQCLGKDCGRQFSSAQALHMHYQRAHEGVKMHTGAPRKKFPSDDPEVRQRKYRKKNSGLTPVDNFRIFTDDEGHIWLAERIR